MEKTVNAHIKADHYATVLTNNRHTLVADEPLDFGGTDLGFSPSELLCSALAACTCITLRMYADRKGWALTDVKADISVERDKETNTTRFNRQISLSGDLTEQQQTRLLNIANQCPIHKTLTNPIVIDTALV
jgi:putative redox protein